MNQPRVLVGVPTSDYHAYCINEFLEIADNFSYDNYKLQLTDNSKTDTFFKLIQEKKVPVIKTPYLKRARERVTRDHNLLRDIALKEKYDYLFILDQDVIPPRDAIQRLISHKKDIVYGLYFGHHVLADRTNEVMPFAWVFKKGERKGHWGKVRYLNPDEYEGSKILKVAFCGGGCIMINKETLEKLKFRFSLEMDAWDDRWFGYDAHEKGLEVYLDPTVKCRHLYLKRPFIWQDLKEKGLV